MLISAEEAAKAHPRRRVHARKAIPDLDNLPSDALITRAQLSALIGAAVETLKAWDYGRAGKGLYAGQEKGPVVTRIEGLPRYRAGDVKAWLAGTVAAK
jgi:hypothetical protein